MTETRRPRSTPRSDGDVDILATDRDDHTGDFVTAPVIAPEVVLHDVEVNLSLARKPGGARCIRVSGLTNMTLAEGKALIADLTETVRAVGEVRAMLGFDD
jgi:hypothetical protein